MAEINPDFLHPILKKTPLEIVGTLLNGRTNFKKIPL